jgi:hypothetical protein
VVLIARITGAIAALTWLIGAPLFSLVYLVLWISLPVWLTVVVIGLSEIPGARTARSAGQ